jgi:hypothetical protein
MWSIDRREFLSRVSASIAGLASASLIPLPRVFPFGRSQTQSSNSSASVPGSCWLDVCAPFILEDNQRGIHTEIVLTSDTFVGARGYADGADLTDYEIYLYDAEGRAIGADGIAKRLTVPAMRTTVLKARELIGTSKDFWGGMRIRLRPRSREPMPASDLFSSAFVRWQTEDSFDNVHANPDPLQWQKSESFYYSMPFPKLSEYLCTFALFNPNGSPSAGAITVFDNLGNKAVTRRYELEPYSSLLLSLNSGDFVNDPGEAFTQSTTEKTSRRATKPLSESGLLAVTNDPKTVKSFAYLLIRQPKHPRFSVEHPIHQGVAPAGPATLPFDPSGNFKAKNVLYSPLLFRGRKFGPITLETRCLLGTGLCAEPVMWLAPFATDADGNVQWDARTDPKLPQQLPASQFDRRAIRLAAEQSCVLDFQKLGLKDNFSGGLSLPVFPDTTHTLMKVEVRVPEWGAHAFSHFRPGFRAARSYQKAKQRGGIATDYISAGARLERQGKNLLFDELIAVINIDSNGLEGRPSLELFGSTGLITRVGLGAVPGFAARHYLLSELVPGGEKHGPLTLRLLDEQATLLMSTLHVDYGRRDIALDHGSDRFSTLLEYGCLT